MAGNSNQKISFKKKEYNELQDSGNGVIVFDSSENKIYVGGVCYSSDVADASYNSTNKTLTITKRDRSSSTIDIDIVRSIDDLTDATVSSPANRQSLVYDSTSECWVNGFATAGAIPYGRCDGTSTATAFTATVPGITELKDGTCMLLKNGVVTSAAGFTINVNGLGAKPVYQNMADATAETKLFNVAYTILFIYDETRVSGGCWIYYRGYYIDSNPIGYQLRTNSSTRPMSDNTVRYRLLFSNEDESKWIPANTSDNTKATTTKTVNQRPINPFGRIVYYSTTTAVSSGSSPDATYLWDQYNFSLGYSFNRTGAALVLSYPAPVYVKCAPQADGSAIIDSTQPYVQALPSTNDGKIYIYLGQAYSKTNIELEVNHPVFYHDGGGIRVWTGATQPTVNDSTITIQKNGTTVDSFTTNASSNKTINITGVQDQITSTNKLSADLVSDGDTNKVFTATEQSKLSGIAAGANVNVQANWNQTTTTADDYIKNKPTIGNATITIKKNGTTVDSFTTNATSAKSIDITVPTKTSDLSNDGDGTNAFLTQHQDISGKQDKITSTNKLSADLISDGTTNKVFTATEQSKLSGIAAGAEVNVQSDWNQTTTTADDYIKNKPTIPTVNNKTITIKKNGTTVDSFTTNASANKTIDITGVQDQITSTNKLSADLISDGTTNKVFTATEQSKLSGIAEGANVNVQADWNQTTTSADDYIKNKPTIPTVNNSTITIQKNGTTVDSFTTNASSAKTINITVPTSAADVSALPSSTKYAASLDLSINSTTYVVTAQLKDQDGNNLGTADTIDLPLESVVVNGSYNNSTKKVVLTLQSGSTVEFSVADLVSGLQSEITSTNKLSADLISDGTTNKVFTATEQSKLSGIAAGAEVNVQSDWNQTTTTADDYIKNKPTIPTVNNKTITIKKNGTTVDSFTTNASSNKTIDITGVQDQITSSNPLSADLITDGTTNKVFTATEQSKLANIAAGAEVNVQADWNQSDSTADDYIKNKPDFSDIPITYSELKSLRDNGELVPKQTYRITDYVTMITPYIMNYMSLSTTEQTTDEICECARVSPDYKQYDILVTAIDESHLSEDCRMAKHGNETYFDNLDLPSWKIKYSLDNDRSKYDWAMDYYTGTVVTENSTVDVTIVKWYGKEVSGTTTFTYVIFGSDTDGSDSDVYYIRTPAYSENSTLAAGSVLQIDGSSVQLGTCTHHTGKGVVYHMEDMNSNKLSYDYVNIQFKEYAPSGFSSNMDEYYSKFETNELREKIFYSAQNDVYDRFLNFYSTTSLIGGSSTNRFDIDYNNFDWYYTFDQYDATNGTHTNVFAKCYDNIIGPTYNACYNIIGIGASVYVLPYNVYQFREGFLERLSSSPESPFREGLFFVSGVRYPNNMLGNVFMYSSNPDMSSILDNDISRIVDPVKSDTFLVGCAFKDCSNIKINSYNGYFLESYDLDIQGGVNALVYGSHSVKVGTSDEKITLYDSNSIWCGTRTHELTAYASYVICMGDCCSFYGVNAHYVYMGNSSAFETTDNDGGGNIMHINIGSDAQVRSVKNVSDINIGNGSFVSCIQGASNISVGVYCNDISICSPDNVGIQKVKIGDFCTNIRMGTTENPMRCENCTIEENVGYLDLYNSNADYLDLYSADVLKNLTVNKSYTIGSSNWLNVNGVPLNDIYNKRIGFNSNRVAVLYVEEDLIEQNPPTLSAITFGTDGQYLLVYFNGDEMMYGTNDGTTPSPYNYAYRVSRAGAAGYNYYQLTPVAGTTYKFVRYSSTDPFATSPIATYQA